MENVKLRSPIQIYRATSTETKTVASTARPPCVLGYEPAVDFRTGTTPVHGTVVGTTPVSSSDTPICEVVPYAPRSIAHPAVPSAVPVGVLVDTTGDGVGDWAVTKGGSRRRRGYDVDSSWTEAALSR